MDFPTERYLLIDIKDEKKDLNKTQGVYGLWYGKICLYIGSSVNLWERLNTHRRATITKDIATNSKLWKKKLLYEFILSRSSLITFSYIKTANTAEVEEELLKKYKPRYAIQGVKTPYKKPTDKNVGFDWS